MLSAPLAGTTTATGTATAGAGAATGTGPPPGTTGTGATAAGSTSRPGRPRAGPPGDQGAPPRATGTAGPPGPPGPGPPTRPPGPQPKAAGDFGIIAGFGRGMPGRPAGATARRPRAGRLRPDRRGAGPAARRRTTTHALGRRERVVAGTRGAGRADGARAGALARRRPRSAAPRPGGGRPRRALGLGAASEPALADGFGPGLRARPWAGGWSFGGEQLRRASAAGRQQSGLGGLGSLLGAGACLAAFLAGAGASACASARRRTPS